MTTTAHRSQCWRSATAMARTAATSSPAASGADTPAQRAPTCHRARPTGSRTSPACTSRARSASRRKRPSAERWKPAPMPGGRTIGPTDFGAREAAETRSDAAHIEESTQADGGGSAGRQDTRCSRGCGEMRKEIYATTRSKAEVPRSARPLPAGRGPARQHAGLLQLVPDPAEAGLRRHRLRVEPHDPHHSARRPPASRSAHPAADGRLARPLGGKHARGGRHQFQRRHMGARPWRRSARASRPRRRRAATASCTAPICTSSSATRRSTRTSSTTRRGSRIPKAFTRPFTISFDAMVRGRPDHQIFEYACHEGNRDGILMATGVDIDPEQKMRSRQGQSQSGD